MRTVKLAVALIGICAAAPCANGGCDADDEASLLRLQSVSAQRVDRWASFWSYCAAQFHECACQGKVRWGNDRTWVEYEPKTPGSELRLKCNVAYLPDVLPGEEAKHCECMVNPRDTTFQNFNPGLMPTALAQEMPAPVTSCDILRDGKTQGPWGVAMWEASQAFCDRAWEDSSAAKAEPGEAIAGSKALDPDDLQHLMQTWLDPRFKENYMRLYDASGWLPRGYVSFYAGPPDGKFTSMMEVLIDSVHKFSAEPIVVVNFGQRTPGNWTPDIFPQLVLLHAAPLPPGSRRSFNFNKMRAMLLARVRSGVELDADQFVAPGVDMLFESTEQEVTKSYPKPILPAHFLDRSPKDGGDFWERYCPSSLAGNCRFQTMRWGHAHPTWTFWALPFIGRWLRRNFRDETLPSRDGAGAVMAPVRVTAIKEDEDLLNIALWEEGGTKQWCKIDQADPTDFDAVLGERDKDGRCTVSCGNIDGDSRWHPNGVAKVFVTAHHAVKPDVSRWYVEQLEKRHLSLAQLSKLPPPIMFGGRFYRNGKELKLAHPEVKCVI
eukprot:gnl/TRDRNA2_/TRDRNA2_184194_c0_seq1.p1 gnl/TRDRNA2_/TRDRNA2_184194_c0~~gnl/TRDRNA2_/TRDRNA2_184194_c0_seq1.p1  ORF type:complete len:549 (-),score=104.22 gnl/TRDRNA2_/TRDRNA2_184194_c0_seq1:189-1835(-)